MEAAEEHTIHHFSHQHPLELTILPSVGNITCDGCNLRILPGMDYYNCKNCSFCLHRLCYNMPQQIRHPSHPQHPLSLLVSSPSANSTFKCKACHRSITGFYYNCSQCGIYYHIVCSALPLSVVISSHPHPLKIEFSPPYDFCCDLCDKPSYKGWLYRCRFCEFDTHISCAISNQRQQSMLLRDTNQKKDYRNESEEVMQLAVHEVARGIEERNGQEVIHTAVAGWDERLRSPKEKLNISGGMGSYEYQTKSYMPKMFMSPGEHSRNQDPSTPLSEDLTIPSYQFSDLCFSIDLLDSYTSHNHAYQANKEVSYHDMKFASHAKAAINKDSVPDKTLVDSKRVQQQLDHPSKPVFNPLYRGPENWLNEAFFAEAIGHYGVKLGQDEKRTAGKSEWNIKSDEASSMVTRVSSDNPSSCSL